LINKTKAGSGSVDIEAMRRGAEDPVLTDHSTMAQAAQDLADAFVTDPHVSWFVRGDRQCDAARLKFFQFILAGIALPGGEARRPLAGGAAAVWIPSEALGPSPLIEELKLLPLLLSITSFSRFGRLAALRAAMDKHHPMDRPHSYLMFIGVAPRAQGLGVGSRLLKAGLDRLDAEGRPAFLETSTARNVALYRRHGFEIIADYRPSPTGPQTYGMWRNVP
jgi:ribosomal protein S18 acetylase RimI-like enzyme